MKRDLITFSELSMSRHLPPDESITPILVTNNKVTKLISTKHGFDTSTIPPLDLREATEPVREGSNWRQASKRAKTTRDQYDWMSPISVSMYVLLICLLVGLTVPAMKAWLP